MFFSTARAVKAFLRRLIGFAAFDSLYQYRQWPVWEDPLKDAQEGPAVFVEPHYDDVVFSCGGTVSALRAAGQDLHLVSVFTGAPSGPLSPLAEKVHETWEEDGASHPYELRRREAAQIVRDIGVQHHELDLPEVIYRDGPFRQIGDIFDPTVPVDRDPLIPVLADALAPILDRIQPAVLFLPSGIGFHYDHRVVRAAWQRLSGRSGDAPAVWWYEDFPYVTNPSHFVRYRMHVEPPRGFALVDVTDTFEDRVRWAAMYDQQCRALFGTPDKLRTRMYTYSARVGTPDRPHERFWTL